MDTNFSHQHAQPQTSTTPEATYIGWHIWICTIHVHHVSVYRETYCTCVNNRLIKHTDVIDLMSPPESSWLLMPSGKKHYIPLRPERSTWSCRSVSHTLYNIHVHDPMHTECPLWRGRWNPLSIECTGRAKQHIVWEEVPASKFQCLERCSSWKF